MVAEFLMAQVLEVTNEAHSAEVDAVVHENKNTTVCNTKNVFKIANSSTYACMFLFLEYMRNLSSNPKLYTKTDNYTHYIYFHPNKQERILQKKH